MEVRALYTSKGGGNAAPITGRMLTSCGMKENRKKEPWNGDQVYIVYCLLHYYFVLTRDSFRNDMEEGVHLDRRGSKNSRMIQRNNKEYCSVQRRIYDSVVLRAP